MRSALNRLRRIHGEDAERYKIWGFLRRLAVLSEQRSQFSEDAKHEGFPCVTRKDSTGALAQAATGPPPSRRQIEQWQ